MAISWSSFLNSSFGQFRTHSAFSNLRSAEVTSESGKLDEHNRLSNDLRFDVGIDGELAKRAGGFIPLELIYEAAMEKTGGVPFNQYAKQNYRSEVR